MLSAFLDNPIVTILLCIALFSFIVKIIEVIAKVTIVILIVIICFLALRFLLNKEIAPIEEMGEPVPSRSQRDNPLNAKKDDTVYVSNHSNPRVNQSPKGKVFSLIGKNQADIVIRHEHYFPEGLNISPNLIQEGVDTENDLNVDLYETIPIVEYSCEHAINNNRFILAVSFNQNETYAAAYVEELKKSGFHAARYFWLPCYDTDRNEEMYIVTIDRPCKSQKSIQKKLRQNIKKGKSVNIEFPSKAIIFIHQNAPSFTQQSGWVNGGHVNRDLKLI